jgi:hypothetical protein
VGVCGVVVIVDGMDDNEESVFEGIISIEMLPTAKMGLKEKEKQKKSN